MEAPHSAHFFRAERDFWWNLDHIGVWAQRVGLDGVRSALDVGSGVGHWGRLLAHVLAPDTTVVGIDREPRWVEQATANAADAGLADRFSYRLASAEELPFEDEAFDLVTCQTLLIHVADARAVIDEMIRVTKRGGLVVASEPNNRALTLMVTSVSEENTVDEHLDVARFYMTCEQGKIALGHGNSSLGDLVPGYFNDAGLEDIKVCQSDKVSLMVPPYASPDQQALKEAYLADAEEGGGWGWTKEEGRRYYEAGGGDPDEFDGMWERRMDEARILAAAIEDETYHAAGGDVHYLISGRKP